MQSCRRLAMECFLLGQVLVLYQCGKLLTESDPFTCLITLEGHQTGQVTCFIVGGQRLYSGSVDKTIKVWDLNILECTMTLRQHTDTMTSLLCWDQYLISFSLFRYSTNTRKEEQCVHTLCGVNGGQTDYVLLLPKGTVSICDLPSVFFRFM